MLRPWRFSKNPDVVSLFFGVTYTRMRLHEFRLNLTWFPASSPNMNIRNNYQGDIIKIKCGFWDTPRNPDESSSTSEFFIFSHLVWQLLRCLPWHSFCHHDWISWPSSLKRCELCLIRVKLESRQSPDQDVWAYCLIGTWAPLILVQT